MDEREEAGYKRLSELTCAYNILKQRLYKPVVDMYMLSIPTIIIRKDGTEIKYNLTQEQEKAIESVKRYIDGVSKDYAKEYERIARIYDLQLGE